MKKKCVCGNVIAESAKSCSVCGEKFETASFSPVVPVIFWSVITFVAAIAIGLVLQGA